MYLRMETEKCADSPALVGSLFGSRHLLLLQSWGVLQKRLYMELLEKCADSPALVGSLFGSHHLLLLQSWGVLQKHPWNHRMSALHCQKKRKLHSIYSDRTASEGWHAGPTPGKPCNRAM